MDEQTRYSAEYTSSSKIGTFDHGLSLDDIENNPVLWQKVKEHGQRTVGGDPTPIMARYKAGYHEGSIEEYYVIAGQEVSIKEIEGFQDVIEWPTPESSFVGYKKASQQGAQFCIPAFDGYLDGTDDSRMVVCFFKGVVASRKSDFHEAHQQLVDIMRQDEIKKQAGAEQDTKATAGAAKLSQAQLPDSGKTSMQIAYEAAQAKKEREAKPT